MRQAAATSKASGGVAREYVLWHKPFTKVLDESNPPFFKWFHDGEVNASSNCLDRHLKTQPDKVAIIFEGDDGSVTKITYNSSTTASVSSRTASSRSASNWATG